MLEFALTRNVQIICYAVDTFLDSSGTLSESTFRRAQARVLDVPVGKTEAVWFFQPTRNRKPLQSLLLVNGQAMQIQAR